MIDSTDKLTPPTHRQAVAVNLFAAIASMGAKVRADVEYRRAHVSAERLRFQEKRRQKRLQRRLSQRINRRMGA